MVLLPWTTTNRTQVRDKSKNIPNSTLIQLTMESETFWRLLPHAISLCVVLYHGETVVYYQWWSLIPTTLLFIAICMVQNILRFPSRCKEYLPLPIQEFIDGVIEGVMERRRERARLKAVMEAKDQWDFSHRYLTNGPVPDLVKVRDTRINSNGRCAICWEPLGQQHNEVLLFCGHRFHSHCLRKWETNQYETTKKKFRREHPFTRFSNEHVNYRCPNCRVSYQWTQKWDEHLEC